MPSQLALPLALPATLTRGEFIVAAGNEQAVAFIDSWPDWPVSAAALYGPAGSGKSHLAAIWSARSGAAVVSADALSEETAGCGPIAVENVDATPASKLRDSLLFRLLENASPAMPVLLTGIDTPRHWQTALPDLASRFGALLSFPLWAPDDALLVALARKLLADRQLVVSDSVVDRMIRSLERSPDSIRKFVAKADAKALAEARPISLALVRELIAEIDAATP